jgi:tetratricopeptide (TPR) repeat protein
MRYFLFFIFFHATWPLLNGQNVRCDLTQAHQRALQSIFQISDCVPQQLKQLELIDANNQANTYLHHYFDFIRFLTFEDSVDYKRLMDGSEAQLKNWKLSDTSPLTYSFKANIYFHIGIAEAMRDKRWRSLKALIEGYELIQQASALFTDNSDLDKFNALFLILFDQMPDGLEWVSTILNIKGDVDKGFAELHQYVESVKNSPGVYEEALLYESFAYLKFSSESADYSKKLSLIDVIKASPPLTYLSGSLMLKNHQPANNRYSSIVYLASRFPLLNYLNGRMLLNQLNDSCLIEFDAFIRRYKGSTFKTDVKLRQCWWYRLNGLNAQAIDLYHEVHESKSGIGNADRQASHEMEFLFSTNLQLIKARLLFDGGKYNEALSVLVKDKDTILKDAKQAEEYYYRMARAYHAMGEFELAIENYRKVINEKTDSERYFSPQSALYVAQIYFKQNRFTLSSQFLDQCFELNNGEYKEDINREAMVLRAKME